VFDREREVTQKEKRLAKKEEHLDQREEVITALEEKLKAYNAMLEKQRDEQTAAVASLQKLQRELDDRASNIALAEENLKAKDASLEERATDLAWQEKDLAFREEMWDRRDKLLADHELEAEEKENKQEEKERTLEERVRWFQAMQAAQVAQATQAAPGSLAVEAMKKTLEDLRAEHRTAVQRIAAWADEASSVLVPLGVTPIPVSKQSVSISDALPVLDSVADRLRRLDQIFGARLEAEGIRLYRAVIEYILTCFRSHDPAISLEPVIAGLVADAEDAARGSVQDAVDVVAERFQWDPTDYE
jgi:chromosome segregation ATPase